MKLFLRILGISTFVTLIIVAIFFQKSYYINTTASFPIGIYKMYDQVHDINRNDMVIFCPSDTKEFQRAKDIGYLKYGVCHGNYMRMLKKVSGIPDDEIEINKYVYVNGNELKNSIIYDKDSKGNLLPKLKEHIKLKGNEYFLMSDYNVHSYDSRYFGVIKKEQIIGKVKAIFVF